MKQWYVFLAAALMVLASPLFWADKHAQAQDVVIMEDAGGVAFGGAVAYGCEGSGARGLFSGGILSARPLRSIIGNRLDRRSARVSARRSGGCGGSSVNSVQSFAMQSYGSSGSSASPQATSFIYTMPNQPVVPMYYQNCPGGICPTGVVPQKSPDSFQDAVDNTFTYMDIAPNEFRVTLVSHKKQTRTVLSLEPAIIDYVDSVDPAFAKEQVETSLPADYLSWSEDHRRIFWRVRHKAWRLLKMPVRALLCMDDESIQLAMQDTMQRSAIATL